MQTAELILNIKYVVAGMLCAGIILAPAYLAVKTKKGKVDAMRIRLASWVFGWTIIGWFLALFWAIKK